jgi:type VI secretion system protein ImpC
VPVGPTEIIVSSREFELSQLGFLPLSSGRALDYATFVSCQTARHPHRHARPEVTADAVVAARLDSVLVSSRFLHYLMIIARDHLGRSPDPARIEEELNRWIRPYTEVGWDDRQERRFDWCPLVGAWIGLQKAGTDLAAHWVLEVLLKQWMRRGVWGPTSRFCLGVPVLSDQSRDAPGSA